MAVSKVSQKRACDDEEDYGEDEVETAPQTNGRVHQNLPDASSMVTVAFTSPLGERKR